MKILLDTCEFLWLVSGDPKLSVTVSTAIRDPNNQVFLSAVDCPLCIVILLTGCWFVRHRRTG